MTEMIRVVLIGCLLASSMIGCNEATGDESAVAADVQLDHTQDIRGHCEIDTGYADDHACLPAPSPHEGYQFHLGPKDYDDPAEIAKFVLAPGEESTECYTLRTTNAEPITFQTAVLSGRAGTHHIINTTYESGDLPTDTWGACELAWDPDRGAILSGYLPGASRPYMPRGLVAPEYANVGRRLPAHALVASDVHYFNFTDKPMLREVWINLYYAPPETVTVIADTIRGYGGIGWYLFPILPGTDKVYSYECPIRGNGSIMSLLGHYHSHGKHLSASIKHANGTLDKVFEMFDYQDPAAFEYNSLTTNPGFNGSTPGAISGPLNVVDGDVLQWQCHIVNDSDESLRFVNEVKTGEMCNIWGASIGIAPIDCDLL
jgi:hypothetical protein